MPSMSPKTQQFQMAAGAGVDQTALLFEQGFSQTAYNVLMAKMPDIVPDIVTFKVLDSDVERGLGIGAFIVMHNDNPLYIPVVMSDNNIKPLELIYHKALNIFLPLSKQWLDEIKKTSLNAMGKGVKTPDTLYSDVDIRNIVVPPLTGRFSYASLEEDLRKILNKSTLEKEASEPRMALLDFLNRAPNQVKNAFSKMLEKNTSVLKTAARIYGVNALTESLRTREEKTATTQHTGGALWIADKDTKPVEFKRIFGENAAEAYSGVRLKGFASKDTRTRHNMAVQEQINETWVEPNQPGVYTLFSVNGEKMPALVIPHPTDLFETDKYDRHFMPRGKRTEKRHATLNEKSYLAVFADGSYLTSNRLAGRPSAIDEISGSSLYSHVFGGAAGPPKQGKGFFVRQRGATIQATRPIEIQSIVMGSDDVRRIIASPCLGYPRVKTLITQEKSPIGTIASPREADVVYMPHDYAWVPLKESRDERSFFQSAHDLAKDAYSVLASVGAKKVAVKNAGAGMFSIDGTRATDHITTLKKLAHDFVLPVNVAEQLIKKAASDRHVNVWVTSKDELAQAQMLLSKCAKDFSGKGDKEDKGAKDTPADPLMGGDPSIGEDPTLGMPPPAPPPSPTDMAAAEMDQHIQQEMQKLVEKQQMLQALTMRANEIAGGAPMLPTVQNQMMGAVPPSQNLATGAPTSAGGLGMEAAMAAGTPAPAGDMGMGMGGAGSDPEMMAAPGGALPQAGMDAAMGMDPSMGGGPSMGQPPMAMMGQDGPNAGALDTEINPQFLQQAASLNSDDVFDAAAVSSIAQSPAVKELVGQYLPNLEKALDNVARVQLSLWMQETDLKTEIGEQEFNNLEEGLRSTFKTMGDLILKLSQGTHSIKGQSDSAHP